MSLVYKVHWVRHMMVKPNINFALLIKTFSSTFWYFSLDFSLFLVCVVGEGGTQKRLQLHAASAVNLAFL